MSRGQQTPNGLPVAHADHGLTKRHFEVIDEVISTFEVGSFVRIAVPLPDDAPALLSALYGPAAGDKVVTEDLVTYEKRNGRPGPSRLVERPHRSCRRLAIIGIAGKVIFTAYGTQALEPSPREWWDTNMKPAETVEAARFWMDHALAK